MIFKRDLGMREYGTQGQKARYGLYECPDCNKDFEVLTQNVKRGFSTHCRPCSMLGKNAGHGETKTRLYTTWQNMRRRCEDQNHANKKRYIERGITVCQEWQAWEPFRDWAKNNGYSDELTIDRIDNDGNYEPSNCQWATRKQQANNKTHPVGKSGYPGIYVTKSGTFQTRAKGRYIGTFGTLAKALEAQHPTLNLCIV